jgi:Ca-activated chloride channel homolog
MKSSSLPALALALAGCGGSLGNGLAPPAATDPNVVLLEGVVGNAYLPSHESAEVAARVRIATNDADQPSRPAINLALAVDTSGSMEGAPIDDARAAALAIVDELEPGDQLAVIVFHSTTEVLVPSTKLTSSNRAGVKAKIARMQARGTTDLAGGLAHAIHQARAGHIPDGINRIVLLGDGVANDGTQLLSLAQSARDAGLSITALGLGLDYDETMLAGIAQMSGGKFHYIDDSSKVAGVFRGELLRIERVVARNATVTFVPGPGVTIREVVGQQVAPAGDGRSAVVHLGDISHGDERDLLLRLEATGGRPGAAVELMDAVLRFEDTVAGAGMLERRVYLSARATDDAAAIEAARDHDVERSLERARAAAAMVQAISMARSGRIDQGQELLERAEAEARRSAKRFGSDAELLRHADSMVQLRDALPAVAPDPIPDASEARASGAGVIRRSHDRAVRTLQGQ